MKAQVYYPLTYANAFPDIPSEGVLKSLVGAYCELGHLSMPLVSQIPASALRAPNKPEYLTYAMAAVGAVISATHPSITHALWSTANMLVASTLEVDNREARKADLINAVCEPLSIGGAASLSHRLTTHIVGSAGDIWRFMCRLVPLAADEHDKRICGNRRSPRNFPAILQTHCLRLGCAEIVYA